MATVLTVAGCRCTSKTHESGVIGDARVAVGVMAGLGNLSIGVAALVLPSSQSQMHELGLMQKRPMLPI